MKKKTVLIYLLLMIACLVLNFLIRVTGNISMLNYIAIASAAFTCGIYTSQLMNIEEDDTDEESKQN